MSSPEAKYAAHGAAEPSLMPEPAPATGGDDVAEAAAAREPSARESEADSQALHLWKSALQEIHLTTLLKDCLSRKVVTLSHTATLAEALRVRCRRRGRDPAACVVGAPRGSTAAHAGRALSCGVGAEAAHARRAGTSRGQHFVSSGDHIRRRVRLSSAPG